MPFVMRNKQH